ncbi:beta-ketoacyl synthase N-terminal-like domain-containing protein [Nocardia tengchongensis]|uniref:beta-ketoacyl synthase N-terminal-like domain-containing protein n=1 Tax=Nocardia tengchongensis TaxID=2055889 RepID=UPI0036A69DF3
MDSQDMKDVLQQLLDLSQRQRGRIAELEAEIRAGGQDEIAIVGAGVRLPGEVVDPESFWAFLSSGSRAVSRIPSNRLQVNRVHDPAGRQAGTSYVDHAGFLSDVEMFDADFFGISEREARSLDPQQRLLLETLWEAAERAGLPLDRAAGLDAGVFVGMMSSEYSDRSTKRPLRELDPYYGTGRGLCFASGRASYTFGLRGPSMTVDTACSSSLVALHYAVRSLRQRECRYAFVGAANLIFSGELMVSLCQSGALAPDGRSKPFLASANGYGRGEGVVTIAVMRLSDALDEGRPIMATIRGTAINHDGVSAGLTVPNGARQEEVIRAALRDAGTQPEDIGYVETHGTGTSLGDPIEAKALGSALAARVAGRTPVRLGTVKSRIGHLEAASGLASVVKTALILGKAMIPADLRPDDGPLSPLVDWSRLRLEVPDAPTPWADEHRLAGVSSFGLSGTNAHVIMGPPPARTAPTSASGPQVLCYSARSAAQLTELRTTLADRLENSTENLADIAYTLAAGRIHHPYRDAVVASSIAEAVRELRAVAAEQTGQAPAPATVRLRVGAQCAVLEIAAALSAVHPRASLAGTKDSGELARGLCLLWPGVEADTSHDGNTVELLAGDRRIVVAGPDVVPAAGFAAATALLYRLRHPVRVERLGAGPAVFVPSLPTYPWAHRRHWIDEVDDTGAVDAATEPSMPTAAPSQPTTTPSANGAGARGRSETQEWLYTELKAVLSATPELDADRSFLELGGDSFTAMLFLRSVEHEFGIAGSDYVLDGERPVRELLEELANQVVSAP